MFELEILSKTFFDKINTTVKMYIPILQKTPKSFLKDEAWSEDIKNE